MDPPTARTATTPLDDGSMVTARGARGAALPFIGGAGQGEQRAGNAAAGAEVQILGERTWADGQLSVLHGVSSETLVKFE